MKAKSSAQNAAARALNSVASDVGGGALRPHHVEAFRKVVHPFDKFFESIYADKKGLYGAVFIEITLNSDGSFFMHGVEAPLRSGNCKGGCGQIDMHYWTGDNVSGAPSREAVRNVRWARGWNFEKWAKLLGIWKNYHLNDLWGQYKPVPEKVIIWLKSLPNSDKEPAWV